MKNATINLKDLSTFENGVPRSIDLSKLYLKSREAQSSPAPGERSLRLLTRTRANPEPLLGLLAPLLLRRKDASVALVRRGELTLVRPVTLQAAATSPLLSKMHAAKPAPTPDVSGLKLEALPPTRTYSVLKSRGTLIGNENLALTQDEGSLELELPTGMPRFVNARTLKAMFGALFSDVLFRKVASRWEICPDIFKVDLENNSQVFRLGKIQIFS